MDQRHLTEAMRELDAFLGHDTQQAVPLRGECRTLKSACIDAALCVFVLVMLGALIWIPSR